MTKRAMPIAFFVLLLVVGVLILALAWVGSQTSWITGDGPMFESTDVSMSLGDLDNDKDLDLVVLHLVQDGLSFHLDGEKTARYTETSATDAVDVGVIDVTDPDGKGADGYPDIVVLTRDRKAGTSELRVWVNNGVVNETGGVRWLGVSKGSSISVAPHAFDALRVGLFETGETGLFLCDTDSGEHLGAIRRGDKTDPWTGFEFDAKSPRKLSGTEKLRAVVDQGLNGMTFLVVDGKDKLSVKRYGYKRGMQ